MKVRNEIIVVLLAALFLVLSCKKDKKENPVSQEVPSFNVKAKINVEDIEYWPSELPVMLQFFELGKNRFPKFELKIEKPKGSIIDIDEKIEQDVKVAYRIKLVVKDSEVKRIDWIDYGEVSWSGDLKLQDKDLKIVSLKRVQEQVFTACLICHGQSVNVSSDLYLLPDSSYTNLVNKPSKNSDMKRVVPYKPEQSFISYVMRNEVSFDHQASVNVTNSMRELLKNWIEKGALNDE